MTSVSAQQLADMLPAGVAIVDHHDSSIFLNRNFRKMMTSTSTQTFDCWSPSIHPCDAERVATAYHCALQSNSTLRIEYRTEHESDPWRLLTLRPLTPDEQERFGLAHKDGARGYICTIADITQEKVAELYLKKVAQEAEQRKQQQERFIDMISHEVRNPLSAILHCTEDILEAVNHRDDDAAQQIPLEAITQAAETISLCVAHQKKIVDDVLTFSKLDASMLTLSPRRVQPRRHLARSLTMFRPELRKQNIQFEYKLDHSYEEGGVDWVMADLDRMAQVLINLVANAIKFTARSGGEKRIRVSMAAAPARPPSYPPNVVFFTSDQAALHLDATGGRAWGEGRKKYIMVAVKDSGIGISDDAQKQLFERFNQATPRTQTEYGGSGLGLNVSRRLCHLHGGEIGVSSQEGQGSTFGFFFTVREAEQRTKGDTAGSDDEGIDSLCSHIQALSNEVTGGSHEAMTPKIPENPPVTHVKEVSPSAPSDGRKKHSEKMLQQVKSESSLESASPPTRNILLVEDNVINKQIVARKLRSLGFVVTEAENGCEALEAFKKSNFDCVLMDQVMPVMDGNAATKAIRDLEKQRGIHVPILGVTANVRAEQREEMLKSGMDAVIHKPYKMNALSAKIQQLVECEECGGKA
ncbi:hypothetical protein FE257_010116 [Aspergillus nanangensis]|uniref:histidine kinase n=1 Tax=Aspergillus nanangensis TaxID=2582783 RepID=A0AAD4CKQ6_ASPNN|nr:hypothetical protein FE257_010116 [Aspergillus nanangensis]